MSLLEDENQRRRFLRLDPAWVRIQQGCDDLFRLTIRANAFTLGTTVVSYHNVEENKTLATRGRYIPLRYAVLRGA